MTNNKQWQLILLYIKYCYKISSKDNNDEEHVMHSKSGKLKSWLDIQTIRKVAER